MACGRTHRSGRGRGVREDFITRAADALGVELNREHATAGSADYTPLAH